MTDQNYVDVVTVTSLSQDTVTAAALGRKMFRSLARGGQTITSLQLSRLLTASGQAVDRGRLVADRGTKYTEEEVVEAAAQYMSGQLPSLQLHLATTWSWPLVPLLALVPSLLYTHLVTSLQLPLLPSLAPHLATTLLLAITCCTWTSLHPHLATHRAWSHLLSLYTDTLPIVNKEEQFLTSHLCVPVISCTALLLLLLPQLPAQPPTLDHAPWPLLVTVTGGCLTSAANIRQLTSGFSFILILNIGGAVLRCGESKLATSIFLNLQSQIGLPLSVDLLQHGVEVVTLAYFVASSLTKPATSLVMHLQAVTWEILALEMVLGPVEAAPRLVTTEAVLLITLVVTIIYSYSYLVTWPRLVTVVSCVLMVTSSLVSQHYTASPPPPSSLTWADYTAACGPTSHAADQALCSQLSGLEVTWTGRLETVAHVSTTNSMEDVLSWLPLTIRTSANIDCVLGDRYVGDNIIDKSLSYFYHLGYLIARTSL